MSWSQTLLDASFRGVTFDVQAEDLEGERAFAQHGVPYRNGDELEDLGRGARQFPMRAVLWGDDYETALQALLRALDAAGPGELIHPIYGSLTVLAARWKVSHQSEPRDYAAIDLLFLEHSAGAPFFERTFTPTEGGTEVAAENDGPGWQAGVRDLFGRIDSLMALVQQYLGGGWVGLLEQLIGLPGIALRLSQLRSQILGVVSSLAAMANNPLAIFDPLVAFARTPGEIRDAIRSSAPSGASRLLARDSVPATLPGGDAMPVEVARAGNALMDSARRDQAIDPEAMAIPDGLPDDPLAASAWALSALVVTELALARAGEVAAVLEDDAQTVAMSPDDLERLVAIPRTLIEGAILFQRRLFTVEQARRVIEPLRNIAALLQARARRVIVRRPPLIERDVASRACLRLLAHRWYGDHRRAGELLRLNPALREPNALEAGDVLRGYAE